MRSKKSALVFLSATVMVR